MTETIHLIQRVFLRDLLLQRRQIKYLVNFCLFFFMLLVFFPLTLRPELALMRMIAPGLIWVAMLLSMLLASDSLFVQEYEHGVMDQWVVSGQSLALIMSAKVWAYWLVNLLPLLILAPVIALLVSFTLWETWVLIVSLLCGTPALFFLGALAATFGIGINQRGALMGLILLPLTLPLFIFGSGTLTIAMQQAPVGGYLALLLAMSVITCAFIPFAMAGVVRVNS